MKRYLVAMAVVIGLYIGFGGSHGNGPFHSSQPGTGTHVPATGALTEKHSGTQVTGEGVVTRILADDTDGSRHQRFIVKLPSGQTVLVAHNIDVAPRIGSLHAGDTVAFNGVFEWNAKGGVLHWTHHDPSGRHEAGWLKHGGQTFQ